MRGFTLNLLTIVTDMDEQQRLFILYKDDYVSFHDEEYSLVEDREIFSWINFPIKMRKK